MTKAIELACYLDEHHEGYEAQGTSIFTRSADELRRLAAVEQENANLLAANNYTSDLLNQALKELADLKAAMGEPVARVNNDGFIIETGLDIAPGVFLYAKAKP